MPVDVTIDTPGIEEIVQAIAPIVRDRRLSILAIIPEVADFDIKVMRKDHSGGDGIKVISLNSTCTTTRSASPVSVFRHAEEALA